MRKMFHSKSFYDEGSPLCFASNKMAIGKQTFLYAYLADSYFSSIRISQEFFLCNLSSIVALI